ncbi:anaerobic dimethyl sulfoxide reductase subunit C [Klebsiella oxytoca]|nr:anaerobic dimethyl sulfoxide reductase subunit C [Klebsiella oxytoca]
MGNGWHEWPLVLFTVLGQSVAGAIIVSGLGWLSLNNNSEARQRLVRGMFFYLADNGDWFSRVNHPPRLAAAGI